ncbi:MAG: AhpC/TSA family protein [Candidatus Methanospirareceae archaeon]
MCREHVAQLCQRQHLFKQLNTKVIIISFSPQELAQRWIEETCSPFIMLLDQDRQVYQAYGLRRSLIRSWNPATLWFYSVFFLIGRKWRGIWGDSNKLGGDFIIGAAGVFRFVRPSQMATDRPAVDDLFTVLHQINGHRN